ncbi:hypothetical protein [Nostoc sp.]|uniref:hypothetical protein n=1 Tax=Nostoc sp. TaxID=1180 RepID=UPI003FA598EE
MKITYIDSGVLISATDGVGIIAEKALEIGCLINRKKQEVELYRPVQDVEVLKSPQTISRENILSGFVLDLQRIW